MISLDLLKTLITSVVQVFNANEVKEDYLEIVFPRKCTVWELGQKDRDEARES